jgi:hypothetical protein
MIVSPKHRNVGSFHSAPALSFFTETHSATNQRIFRSRAPVLSASSLCPFIRGMTERNIETVISALTSISFLNIHGVSNTNRCAEGVSPDDEFRIVQTRPTSTDPRGKGYFNISLDRNFILLRQFGPYQVFKRS